MKIFDISWPISPDMTQYKDSKVFQAERIQKKGGAFEHNFTMNSHMGTHVDAPAHFIPGAKTIDQLPLYSMLGPCKVLDLISVQEVITTDDLIEFDITKGDIILLKTDNSFRDWKDPFNYSFVYLDGSAAEYLIAQDITAIGIDYLGIERNQPDHETHTAFMQFNIPIIEGLRLGEVVSGNYFLCCLPLKMMGFDGAPARALLIEE